MKFDLHLIPQNSIMEPMKQNLHQDRELGIFQHFPRYHQNFL